MSSDMIPVPPLSTAELQALRALVQEKKEPAYLNKIALKESGETVLPVLSMSDEVFWRSPCIWPIFFEERNVTLADFLSANETEGMMPKDFRFWGKKHYSSDPVISVVAEPQLVRIERVVACFCSLGSFFATFNFTSDESEERAVDAFWRSSKQLRQSATLAVDDLNIALLEERGGNQDRFRAAKAMDPAKFPLKDKHAIVKAQMRGEAFAPYTPSNRQDGQSGPTPKKEKTCNRCGKLFTGDWKTHQRGGCR